MATPSTNLIEEIKMQANPVIELRNIKKSYDMGEESSGLLMESILISKRTITWPLWDRQGQVNQR